MASSPEPGSPGPQPADSDRVRWPMVARLGVVLAVVTVVGGIVAALLAAFVIDRNDRDVETVIVDAVDPVAPVSLADGSFLFAERTTGRIVRVTDDGESETFATLADELRTDGQRGLLGLSVRELDGSMQVFASWTRASDDRLVVGRVDDGGTRLVWEGPVSVDFANGGTLVFRGDELLIGIGELQAPELVDDPTTPNGKVLALDPVGPSDQIPGVVLAGWHNPFALTVVGADVWLVDNAPGSAPERVVRIAPDGSSTTAEITEKRAPSSLAVLPDGDLVVCGFVSGTIERIEVPEAGAVLPSEDLDQPCATGVAVLADGSIVTTTADAVLRSD